MAGNDYNAYEGPGEAPQAVMRKRPGVGQADPNRYTSWDDGSGPRGGERAMDVALRNLPEKACPKCSYKTRLDDDYVRHMKQINGKIMCERQRAEFAGVETCGACKGSGESANGVPCGTCKGMGRILAKSAGAAESGASKEEIVSAVAEVLDKKFDQLIGAIAGLVESTRAQQAQKPERKPRVKKSVPSTAVVQRGAPPSGPGPSPGVESVAEEVADSQGESGEAQ